MITPGFQSIEDVINDEYFPQADQALRRGRHIGREDGAVYDYIADAIVHLEPFYQRLGYEIIHRSEGYFYLLPTTDQISRRHMTAAEMLVGQVLALMYLDPNTLQHGGAITNETLLQRLDGMVGVKNLVRTLNPRRRNFDKINERTSAENIRTKVTEAVRRLAAIGFIDLLDDGSLRLRPSLARFTDPIRTTNDQEEALTRLIKSGEIVQLIGVDNQEDSNHDNNGYSRPKEEIQA